MRRTIAILLVWLVSANLPAGYGAPVPPTPHGKASGSAVKAFVSQVPAGTYVEVRFKDKSKLRGYLFEVQADGFSIRTGDAASGSLHRSAFSDVKSVKVVTRTHTPTAAWIVIGAMAVVLVVVLVGVAKYLHNE